MSLTVLGVAGATREIFSSEAIRRIHELSGGIPRLINILADRALLAAYVAECMTIDAPLVECAEADLQGITV